MVSELCIVARVHDHAKIKTGAVFVFERSATHEIYTSEVVGSVRV